MHYVIQQTYSPDEVLAFLKSANLMVDQYSLMREGAKQKGHNLYLSYFQVQKAKEKCYPDTKTVNETSAKVELQKLLDHT
jgi:hypothetical protein